MRLLLAVTLLMMGTAPLAAQAPTPAQAAVKAEAGPFDPTRDPAKDLEAAKAEAQKTGRRILLDVGGNWCSWCRLMDRWFKERPAIREARDKAFLSPYPKIDGYPHFFVLDADGKLVRDQSTGALEEGRGYSEAKMRAFIAAQLGR